MTGKFHEIASLRPRMTPQQFVSKWTASTLKERSAAQEHFIDLCRVLNEPTPAEVDPHGDWYCFERGARKTTGGDGWADVWRRHCFAWEYKGKHKDLDTAFAQLQRYAPALENPPLLIVSDMERIEIHTNFTNTVHQKRVILIGDLNAEQNLLTLKSAFANPDDLRPGKTKAALTEEAAYQFASLAKVLRDRGGDPQRVAHFLNRILFCLFAQHARLLPDGVVIQLLEAGVKRPDHTNRMLKSLFGSMKEGGEFGTHVIEWFNGKLFDSNDAIPLEAEDIAALLTVARLDWSEIEPSIFGTLFERGLDPDKRNQIGAHYTDPTLIMRIIEPVVIAPLAAIWGETKRRIEESLSKWDDTRNNATRAKLRKEAEDRLNSFLERLSRFVVLDPACGSGNFLYVALQALKDLEHRAILEAEQLGLDAPFTGIHVGVQCVRGIELNTYAAELARVTVWIGEIQWMLRHGAQPLKNPILKPLQTIEQRDALVSADGKEAAWPSADCVVGNPPFLGDKKMIRDLGEGTVKQLRRIYRGRVPGGADLVTYWLERARTEFESTQIESAGFVVTNSIRQGANRKVLDSLMRSSDLFEAWSDEPWVNEGAAVRVSIVCFSRKGLRRPKRLDGADVKAIHADLTGSDGAKIAVDVTQARKQGQNAGRSFFGLCLAGPFAIPGDLARSWLEQANPHGRPNSDVLRPIFNGIDVTRRPQDRWVIDFGTGMSQREAALYEAPFEYVAKHVRPGRIGNREKTRAANWWRHGRPRPELRRALVGLPRYIATPETAKHRYFVWLPAAIAPEHRLVVVPRSDDLTFGILSSRIHVAWALALGGTLEDRPVYNSTLCFETFPFPAGMSPDITEPSIQSEAKKAVELASKELDTMRASWLNPPDWTRVAVEKNLPGYARWTATSGHEVELSKRTLTNLYNSMPTWLVDKQRDLDAAVAAAYGWQDYTPAMADREILKRLLKLNLDRAPDLFDEQEKRLAVVKPLKLPAHKEPRLTPETLQRRLAVVCTLVNRLADEPHFGRTKMAKLFYLADVTRSLELDTSYQRAAAGPLDRQTLYDSETGLEAFATKHGYLSVEKTGRKITYRRGPNLDKAMEGARKVLGRNRAPINRLIDLFRPLDTDQCEIVATLYACWNDRLLDGKAVADEQVIAEFHDTWDDKKRRFPKERLAKALNWMRANHLVPAGRGARTQSGRKKDVAAI